MAQATGRLPTTHRFTIEDLERMVRAGILHEHDRVELIEGELFDMNLIGWTHQACVNRLTELFVRAVGGRTIVQPQAPVRLGERSLPQPDLALLRPRNGYDARSGPGPSDVLLLIEVSDTALTYDRDVKVPLYARAGIPREFDRRPRRRVAASSVSRSQPGAGRAGAIAPVRRSTPSRPRISSSTAANSSAHRPPARTVA
ncbi:MAG: Uma2 family endonuclease [Thermomicrobium sp.]|nr:Uma2 family endonuclease [Thermomicrobium sp.]